MSNACDVLVIGAGLTGLSAAYHAAIRGAEVICIEAVMLGGLLANVGALDDIPGQEGKPGIAFAETLAESCRKAGVDLRTARITGLSATPQGFAAASQDGTIQARKVIVASGASIKKLGLPGEERLESRGVSTCAWCDGGLFRGKPVVVVGSGDSALQGALHLAGLCASVDVLVEGDLTARRSYLLAAADRDTIAFRWDTKVLSIDGDEAVSSVTVEANGDVTRIACAAVFLYPGLTPNAGFVPPQVERDETGALVADPDGRTRTPNLFAAGAVRAGFRGQGVSALGEGAAAAIAASDELQA